MVFNGIFFQFGLFLYGLVLSEAVAPTLHSGRLDGEDEVVVLKIEAQHGVASYKNMADKEILPIVSHLVAKVHVDNLPSLTFKLVDDDSMEIPVVHGIVRAARSGIIV